MGLRSRGRSCVSQSSDKIECCSIGIRSVASQVIGSSCERNRVAAWPPLILFWITLSLIDESICITWPLATWIVVEPLTPLRLAVMLVVPALIPTVKPPWTVAIDCFDDTQLTVPVMSCVVWSGVDSCSFQLHRRTR